MSAPSARHEFLSQLVHNYPEMAPTILRDSFGLELPTGTVSRLDSGNLTNLMPIERHADVVVISDENKEETAIVVEVQLERDKEKRRNMPNYLTNIYARREYKAVLLVICSKQSVANWYARPIDLGHPGWVLRPLVLGPNLVPVITTPERAVAMPELAVLSALAHGEKDTAVVDACTAGMAHLGGERAETYTDYLLNLLSGAARTHLEDLVATGTYQYVKGSRS